MNPQEIEECLMRTEQLVELAVIGVPDELSGNRLIALCVPKDNEISKTELEKHCHHTLPKHQMPSDFILLKTLPKGRSGKVDLKNCLLAYNDLYAKNR